MNAGMRCIRLVAVIVLASSMLAGCGPDAERSPTVASAASRTPDSGKASTPPAKPSALEQYIADMQEFVDCMRENGAPEMPDPGPLGEVAIDTRVIDERKARQATEACQQFAVAMPAEVRAMVMEKQASNLTEDQKRITREYAECMQANGAPDFPDPLPNGLPGGYDDMGPEDGWGQTSAGTLAATATCAPIIGDPVNPGPGVG